MVRAGAMSGITMRERASVFAVLSAMALVVLDAGLVNVALPTIATSLKIDPADAILIVSAYQTALVIGLLPCAHIAERFGYRRLFAGGLGLFSAASVVCAVANSLPMLVAARAVQGLGGAAIMALGVALLRLALGPERLGRAIGWNALTVALCSAGAPVAGAFLLSIAPWPWLFLCKLPISAVALAAATALTEARVQPRSIDTPSIALHASVAATTLVAAGMAIHEPVAALLLFGAAFGVAVALIRRQRSRVAPLWPVDLLALRPFRVSVIASVCCFSAQSTGLLALPFYLQLGLGHGPLAAGLVFTCWPLTVAITSTVANPLAERFGSPALCVAGGLVLGSGLLLSALPPAGSVAPLALGAALSGLGFGLFQVPNNRILFLTVPAERSAMAGGMQGTARLIGQTTGAILMGFLFACAPATIAPRIGFALGSLFAVAAALVSGSEIGAAARPWRNVADARP
jgi:DHA2 family multidrug resistance protein-like MFS transporter